MAKYIYGIDIGGTTVKMGLFDEKGDMLEKWEIVTRKENNGENILPDIVKSIKEKNSEKSIETDGSSGTYNRGWQSSQMCKSRMGNFLGC